MANSKQAFKRARQAETHRQRNTSQASEMRTAIKQCLEAIKGKSKDIAQTAYQRSAVLADRAAKRGIIHANKAARIKARLNKQIKAI